MSADDFYPLHREPTETERLNRQHKLLVHAIGYTVHPAIKETLPAILRVADLATGTGVFLVDLANELPGDSRLEGFDVSDNAFPARVGLPSNVSLIVADAKQPPPKDLHGQYDLVTIRFLTAAMLHDDWKKVAQHAALLLKPGGALQWIEADFLQANTAILLSSPALTPNIKLLTSQFATRASTYWGFGIANLGTVLSEAGFIGLRRDVTSTDRDPADRRGISEVYLGAANAILRRRAILQEEGVWGLDTVENIRRGVELELDEGAYVRADLHQFIAFKEGS